MVGDRRKAPLDPDSNQAIPKKVRSGEFCECTASHDLRWGWNDGSVDIARQGARPAESGTLISIQFICFGFDAEVHKNTICLRVSPDLDGYWAPRMKH